MQKRFEIGWRPAILGLMLLVLVPGRVPAQTASLLPRIRVKDPGRAQWIPFAPGADEGAPLQCTIATNAGGYRIRLETAGISWIPSRGENGLDYVRLAVPGSVAMAAPGRPSVPTFTIRLPLSPGEHLDGITLVSSDERVLSPLQVWPAQPEAPDGSEEEAPPAPFMTDPAVYGAPDAFPGQTVLEPRLEKERHLRHAVVVVALARAEPVANLARVATLLVIDVRTSRGTGGLKADEEVLPPPFQDDQPPIYTILVHHQYENHRRLADFVRWKQEKGYRVNLVTTQDLDPSDGAPSPDQIRDYLRQLPATNYPHYLLVIGDHTPETGVVGYDFRTTTNHAFARSDFEFRLRNTDDLCADLYAGRLPARNAAMLTNMLNKILLMDRNPPANAGYNRVLSAGMIEDVNLDNRADSWYCEDTDYLAYYFEHTLQTNYTCTRIVVNPSNVTANAFWRGDDVSLWHPTNTIGSRVWNRFSPTNGANTAVVAAFNAGLGLAAYRDHGGIKRWTSLNFSTGDIGDIDKPESPALVLSMCCRTGAYHEEPATKNFTTRLLGHDLGGAYGVVATVDDSISGKRSSRTMHGMMAGYLGEYLSFHDRIQPRLWPKSLPEPAMFGAPGTVTRLGPLLEYGFAYCRQCFWSDPTVQESHERNYHLFGDPEQDFRLIRPTAQQVEVTPRILTGATSVTVDTHEAGSQVCLYGPEVGIHLAKLTGPDGRAVFAVPNPAGSGEIKVTSTRWDRIPHQQSIYANPPRVYFEWPGYEVAEGSNRLVGFCRTGATNMEAHVRFAYTNYTATSDDYDKHWTEQILFYPGKTNVNLMVQTRDDDHDEPDETFALTLVADDAWTQVGPLTNTVITISDNDVAGSWVLDPPFVTGWETRERVELYALRQGGSAGEATVTVSTVSGTAVAGSDFVATNRVIFLHSGQSRFPFSITLLDDNVQECPQTFKVVLSNASGSPLGAQTQAVVTIRSEDRLIDGSPLDVDPGWTRQGLWAFGKPAGLAGDPAAGATGTNCFGYNLNGAYGNNIGPQYLTSGPVDCSRDYEVTLSFQQWLGAAWPGDAATLDISTNGTAWIRVWSNATAAAPSAWTNVVHDVSAWADGEPAVRVRWGMGPTDAATVMGGWNIDDVEWHGSPMSVLDVTPATQSITEGSAATFTVSRSHGSKLNVTVDYETVAGNATAGSDYTARTGSLVFAINETVKTVTVQTLQDTRSEPPEVFLFRLRNPSSNAILSTAQGDATILDNDGGAVSFQNAQTVLVEPVTASIRLVREGGDLHSVTVTVQSVNGTAKSGTDFGLASNSFIFAAGSTSTSFKLSIFPDSKVEPTEDFVLRLASVNGNAEFGAISQALVIVRSETGLIRREALDATPKQDWSVSGSAWDFGVPTGGGGSNPQRDPESGYSGSNVWGCNLSGGYANNMGSPSYLALGGLNAKLFTNVSLAFMRWLGVQAATQDFAVIEVRSEKAGWTSWKGLWTNGPAAIADDAWVPVSLDVTEPAAGATNFQVRWGMGRTDGSVTYGGWNLDDIELLGLPRSNQPPSVLILSPVSGSFFWENRAFPLRGAVGDDRPGVSNIVWRDNGALLAEGTNTAAEFGLEAGAHRLTLEAMDEDGVTSEAAVSVMVYRDLNGNGLPDVWEDLYWPPETDPGPDEDPDGDGLTNMQEWRCGTHPTDPASPADTLRYVVKDNPGALPPYTNWATAAAVLQDAVEWSAHGDTVLVSNGVYDAGGLADWPDGASVTSRVAVRKPVTVRSVNGPAWTSIRGRAPGATNWIRCVYLVSGARLEGFTLTNGAVMNAVSADGRGGAVLCESESAAVSNCVVTGNRGYYGGGAYRGAWSDCTFAGNLALAYGGGAYSGVHERCVFRGNVSSNSGGGTYAAVLANSLLVSNATTYAGGGARHGALVNCTVAGNRAGTSGGGLSQGQARNTILWSNSAPSGANFLDGATSLAYCCAAPLPAGEGNVAADPLFRNPASGDWRLRPASPCLDAGTNETGTGVLDLGGGARIRGGRIDLGAYELDPADWVTLTIQGQPAPYGAPVPLGYGTHDVEAGAVLTNTAPAVSPEVSGTRGVCTGWTGGGSAPAAGLSNTVVLTLASNSWLTWQWRTEHRLQATASSNGAVSPTQSWHAAGATGLVTALPDAHHRFAGWTGQLPAASTNLNPLALTMDQPRSVTSRFALVSHTLTVLSDHGATAPEPGVYTNLYGAVLTNRAPAVLTNGLYRYRCMGWTLTDQEPASGTGCVFTMTLQTNAVLEWLWGTDCLLTSSSGPYGSVSPTSGWYVAGSMAVVAASPQTGFSLHHWTGDTNGCTFIGGNLFATMTVPRSFTAWFSPLSPATHYVSVTHGAPLWPYLSWGTAATSIQDAVDAAVTGATILVTNGAYTSGGVAGWPPGGLLTNRVAVHKALTVRSVNGPTATYITGRRQLNNGAIRCAYLADGSVLEGFTLSSGGTRSGTGSDSRGGGVYAEGSATLVNCVLDNSMAVEGGGACSGTLVRCALTWNYATANGGGAFHSRLRNCVLYANQAGSRGGGDYRGALTNCTLAWNQAGVSGGGAFESVLANAVAVSNFATAAPNHTGVVARYSCLIPAAAGPGNIALDPRLRNLPGADLRLQAGSPCIGAGDNALAPAGTDLDARPRILGRRVDMGAYEWGFGDSDADGMPDWWEGDFGLSVSNAADAAAHGDGDGVSNYAEYMADTDPTNPLSWFRILDLASGLPVQLTFPSSSNRIYTLRRSANLLDWLDVPGRVDIRGLGGIQALTDTNAPAATRYYKIRVRIPMQ